MDTSNTTESNRLTEDELNQIANFLPAITNEKMMESIVPKPTRIFITMSKWCVLYVLDKIEHKSPWFYSKKRAKQAFDIITAKHNCEAVIYWD